MDVPEPPGTLTNTPLKDVLEPGKLRVFPGGGVHTEDVAGVLRRQSPAIVERAFRDSESDAAKRFAYALELLAEQVASSAKLTIEKRSKEWNAAYAEGGLRPLLDADQPGKDLGEIGRRLDGKPLIEDESTGLFIDAVVWSGGIRVAFYGDKKRSKPVPVELPPMERMTPEKVLGLWEKALSGLGSSDDVAVAVLQAGEASARIHREKVAEETKSGRGRTALGMLGVLLVLIFVDRVVPSHPLEAALIKLADMIARSIVGVTPVEPPKEKPRQRPSPVSMRVDTIRDPNVVDMTPTCMLYPPVRPSLTIPAPRPSRPEASRVTIHTRLVAARLGAPPSPTMFFLNTGITNLDATRAVLQLDPLDGTAEPTSETYDLPATGPDFSADNARAAIAMKQSAPGLFRWGMRIDDGSYTAPTSLVINVSAEGQWKATVTILSGAAPPQVFTWKFCVCDRPTVDACSSYDIERSVPLWSGAQ